MTRWEFEPRTNVKIGFTWAAPAMARVQTTMGEFTVYIETSGKNWFDGDQPKWLLAQWAQKAVEMIVGHEIVYPDTIGPCGSKIPDNPNRPNRHAYIYSYDFFRKIVTIEVPSGQSDGGSEDRQSEVDHPYAMLKNGIPKETVEKVCGIKIGGF